MRRLMLAVGLVIAGGCAVSTRGGRGEDMAGGGHDPTGIKADLSGGASADLSNGGNDLAGGGNPDLAGGASADLSNGGSDLAGGGNPDLATGVITGGPCLSGATGATAFRIRWIDAGGKAIPSYEVHGLPDKSRQKAGAYGYQIGFQAQFVDPFLGSGGLLLDSSDFVDLELSTVGVPSITTATLSIHGRSFNTTASGSFNWQSQAGTGSTPTNFVSNVAPYQWYSASLGSAFPAGDGGLLLRIKAGPNSGALVVNRIEICLH